jgi:uncharacterized protein
MDKAAAIKIINQFSSAINSKGVTLHKLILYGSFASGVSREGSDIDLIVISDDFIGKDYWERIDILSQAIYEIFAPIEAVAFTREEWENGDSFISDFACDGEVLFAA